MDVMSDFAYSTVLVAPSPATSGLSLTIQSGDYTKFPQTGPFNVAMCPPNVTPLLSNCEIARASGINSGGVITLSFRDEAPTGAMSVAVGWQVFQPTDAWLLSQLLNIAAVCVSTANQPTLSGLLTIDGYTVAAGDRVLLVGQTTTNQNGVWLAASGAWTRPPEWATGTTVYGKQLAVMKGSVYANTTWILDAPTAGLTVDTTAQVWTRQIPLNGDMTATEVGLVRQIVSPSATPTWNSNTGNTFFMGPITTAVTAFKTNWTGTPTPDQVIEWLIYDNGTAHALDWDATLFENTSLTCPTVTNGTGKLMRFTFQWNTLTDLFSFIGYA